MKASITAQTAHGNRYIYYRHKNELTLTHPLLAHLLELHNKGISPEEWLKSQEGRSVTIDGLGTFSKSEINYYCKKFRMLVDNDYLPVNEAGNDVGGRMDLQLIDRVLANIKQVTFEVTDRCNLDCMYCGYGTLYNDYDERKGTDLNTGTAKTLLDFLARRWNSPLNISHDRNVYIGFYGGEPLLNMPFIREVVEYTNNMEMIHNRFSFSITTNAILLEKHMNFFVENGFNLLISLDGDRGSSRYRVFKNGEPAYDHILHNITTLKESYPDYFREHVNFSAVFHSGNTVEEVFAYFKENFGKAPIISEISSNGINPDKKEEFMAAYANVTRSLFQSKNYRELENELFINLPTIKSMSIFLNQYGGSTFRDYPALVFPHKKGSRIPTGTCVPFSRRLYVTVNGKLLPCETISHRFALGHTDEKQVELNPETIAIFYNRYFDELRQLCQSCYNFENCLKCLFNMEFEEDKPKCAEYASYEKFSQYISGHLTHLEENPHLYTRIMKEVVIE